MEILILVGLVLAVPAGILYRRQHSVKAEAQLEDIKQRIAALRDRAENTFVAAPGDARLKDGWEYMTAQRTREEETLTFIFFTRDGITHKQIGLPEEAVNDLLDNGWRINAQTYTNEGMSLQMERPAPQHFLEAAPAF